MARIPFRSEDYSVDGLVLTNNSGTLQVDGADIAMATDVVSYTGGDGVDITSNTLSVDLATTPYLEFVSNQLAVQVSTDTDFTNDTAELATRATIKAFVDTSIASGTVTPWATVDTATTGSNITLSGEQTIDGVLTSASDVLVKDQTDASENGIYTTGAGAWTRRADADASTEFKQGKTVFSTGGTICSGCTFYQSSTSDPTVDTDDITFALKSQTIIADGSITTAKLASDAVTAAKIAAAVAGDGLAGGGGTALSVNVDDSTIEVSSDTVQVKDSGITAAKLAAAIAGDGLAGGGGTALSVNVDDSTIEIDTDTLRVKDGGIALAKLDSSLQTSLADAYTKTSNASAGATQFTLDTVLVDNYDLVTWKVIAHSGATKESVIVTAQHNGHAGGDATAATDTQYGALGAGNIAGFDVAVDVDGSGGTQSMRLRCTSTSDVAWEAVRISL